MGSPKTGTKVHSEEGLGGMGKRRGRKKGGGTGGRRLKEEWEKRKGQKEGKEEVEGGRMRRIVQ